MINKYSIYIGVAKYLKLKRKVQVAFFPLHFSAIHVRKHISVLSWPMFAFCIPLASHPYAPFSDLTPITVSRVFIPCSITPLS